MTLETISSPCMEKHDIEEHDGDVQNRKINERESNLQRGTLFLQKHIHNYRS